MHTPYGERHQYLVDWGGADISDASSISTSELASLATRYNLEEKINLDGRDIITKVLTGPIEAEANQSPETIGSQPDSPSRPKRAVKKSFWASDFVM
ncbi:hypothetical protein Syun_012731 [Stephania yunnanensis]|uniref:Uncharacterized protein n=1 Tax=Stephania yunnanensis TaxID=152371 RepID=A0AAP0K015_9MAGN